MYRNFWITNHPGALALAGIAIYVVAWPMESVPALVVAGLMMVVAAGIVIQAHFSTREA